MTYAFLGGRDFDVKAVSDFLATLTFQDTIVTGGGPGLEKFVREQAPELGLAVEVPPRTDRYGRSFQIAQVIDSGLLGGTLVLVGGGANVQRARRALKRANWNCEVVEL